MILSIILLINDKTLKDPFPAQPAQLQQPDYYVLRNINCSVNDIAESRFASPSMANQYRQ
ncbi:hypothetical protein CKY04_01720 [Photorhabdus sp. S8-52]|nr:hypothetical protein CKY03_01720 [Photorhabdus sp. S9-53]RAX03963.1 hypothetical protein CKY05_01720 [Photorhabdus sp. S10-54]RAX06000.1 hypothetical protein CKY04_01720 [Photorhabdus sp. S8-52]